MTFTRSSILQWDALAVALALVGWNQLSLLIEDPLLGRDDRSLVEPLAALPSFSAYFEALSASRILDLQPVRDASFVVNIWLSRTTGRGFFHATNYVLWIVVVCLVFRLLRSLAVPPAVAVIATCLFAVHPALAMSVSWVAARKHLLSCLFILVATLCMRRAIHTGTSGRLTLGTVSAYALSVFSQPITVLWPIWAATVAWLAGRDRFRRLALIPLCCVPVLIACVALNLSYYAGDYVEQVSADKFVDGPQFGVSLLALGRAFFNLLVPVRIATSYDPGSGYNLVGLLLLAPLGMWSFKRLPLAQALGWMMFALLPLAVVLGRMTHIFLSDSYLLTPAVGLTSLLALLAAHSADWAWPRRRVALGLSVALGVAFWGLSVDVTRSWQSDAQVWARAYEVEPTPNALAKQSYYLASAGRTREALGIALQLKEWAPAHREAEYVLSRAIFLDRTLSLPQKDELLRTHGMPGPWTAYFHAIVHAQRGSFQQSYERIAVALRNPSAFKDELPQVVAEAILVCTRAGAEACESLAAPFRNLQAWSEDRFQARLGTSAK